MHEVQRQDIDSDAVPHTAERYIPVANGNLDNYRWVTEEEFVAEHLFAHDTDNWLSAWFENGCDMSSKDFQDGPIVLPMSDRLKTLWGIK